jgi:6-phospho-beta-glucosidase
MKLTIIGAAGVRTPLIIQSIIARQEKLKLDELCLMDIDSERLELIGALTHSAEQSEEKSFHITRTTDATQALKDADFVITTFRVGGIESRAIDERVPLNYGVLGQETTGPGGFAMGIRSIPVILNYVSLMQEFCPNAWLINFANPAGMLTEAVLRNSEWHRVVGICDAPSAMKLVIADALGAKPEKIYIDYFGLNHLGWIRRVIFRNKDFMPEILEQINISKDSPGLPFDPQLISSLKLIPNEYLYYYYYASQSVQHILQTGKSRGEQISALNLELFKVLKDKYLLKDFDGMQAAYHRYLDARGSTYMVIETQKRHD